MTAVDMYGAGMDALIEDTAEVTRMLKEEWQGVPLILLGHSMGSMVVRCFTKKYDDLLNMLVVCGSPSKNPGAKIGIALAAVALRPVDDAQCIGPLCLVLFG